VEIEEEEMVVVDNRKLGRERGEGRDWWTVGVGGLRRENSVEVGRVVIGFFSDG
jgi:hypothetical protein